MPPHTPSLHLTFRSSTLWQVDFDLSDMSEAYIPTAETGCNYEACELQLTTPVDPYVEGTFSGTFVLDSTVVWEGNSGYLAPINDTIVVKDAYFCITPYGRLDLIYLSE